MDAATPPNASSKGMLKRLLVGRAMSSGRLEHTLLPKILALPVFSSDALSSVIYAPQEIMLVLLAASSSSGGISLPIAAAIGALMVVVVVSYRQTIRAYPSGGGAYIVSKDNLGTIPGLVAASALLIDYILTVSVSIVAGAEAITSAVPGLLNFKLEMSVGFVIFIMFVNLRGAKESGTFFALPVYAFIVSIVVMIGMGLLRCVGGACPQAEAVKPIADLAKTAGPVSLFVVLHAFSSGSAALTGVEAISNGVPAFRRPQSKNAAETLTSMGAIAIVMFLGIAFLASRAGTTVSDERSVVAQVAYAVFNGGPMFYAVQLFSAAILVLAANTSFQDFPRLSAILARDRFMPRQFQNRGDRLVFSNGVLVLAGFAILLILVFDANLSRLIQLYVVGVFTSFTLSQSGMVRHWLKEKHKGADAASGWQRSIVINSIGAVTTFVVLLVVLRTKFSHGAWVVVVATPILVWMFLSIEHHYVAFMAELRRGRVTVGGTGENHVVLLVKDLDAATAAAIGYVRSIRPTDVHAVCASPDGVLVEFQEQWRSFAVGVPDLEPLPISGGDVLTEVREYIRTIPRRHRDFITVVIPEMVRDEGLWAYMLRRRPLVRLKSGLLREPNVVVVDVPVRIGEQVPVGADGRSLIPQRTVALVFVSAVNDATVRAVNYAQCLGANETRAVFFDLDPDHRSGIEVEWADKRLGIPLDVVEAPFRDLRGPMLAEIRRFTDRSDTLAIVVIPEFVLSKWRHLLLHNQNALFVKRLLLFERRSVLAAVPFSLGATD